MKTIIADIKTRIDIAAKRAGRDPESVHLVAVSKTIPEERIKDAIAAGLTVFGENYVQEARDKIVGLSTYPVCWHFIGHLQSNKAKYAVKLFDLIHSVDSLKVARELDKAAKKMDKTQKILIQVNISEEPSKFGSTVHDTRHLTAEISRLENISIKGLMTMPPYFNNPEKSRPYFEALRNLRDRIRKGLTAPNISLDELSMGMTGDFETAIECGATLVRIGTAIFGERN